MDPSQSGSEGQMRVYDPLWTNALTLLDYLDEARLIQRDIKTVAARPIHRRLRRTFDLECLHASKIWEAKGVREMAFVNGSKTRGHIGMATLKTPPYEELIKIEQKGSSSRQQR